MTPQQLHHRFKGVDTTTLRYVLRTKQGDDEYLQAAKAEIERRDVNGSEEVEQLTEKARELVAKFYGYS